MLVRFAGTAAAMTTPPIPTEGGAALPAGHPPASLDALRRRLIDAIMLWTAASLVMTHGFALHRSLEDGTIGWPLLVRLLALGGVFQLPYKEQLTPSCHWQGAESASVSAVIVIHPLVRGATAARARPARRSAALQRVGIE